MRSDLADKHIDACAKYGAKPKQRELCKTNTAVQLVVVFLFRRLVSNAGCSVWLFFKFIMCAAHDAIAVEILFQLGIETLSPASFLRSSTEPKVYLLAKGSYFLIF
ncbi:MAG: hypothetical protein ACI9FR_001208 [Cryomorphaceae bacterium]